MAAVLMHTETGTVVAELSMLRHKDGTRWKFEGIVMHAGEHLIRMSRLINHKIGRIAKAFAPHLFGCHVETGFVRRDKVTGMVHKAYTFNVFGEMKSQTLILLYAGVLALIPLAAFEHFHLAAHLFEWLGNKHATSGGE